MADKDFGGNVPVDFGDVRNTLMEKLDHHRSTIHTMLGDSVLLHDFERFNEEVQKMQATIRTLDVLNGEVDIGGFRPTPKSQRDEDTYIPRMPLGQDRVQNKLVDALDDQLNGGDGGTNEPDPANPQTT